MQAAQKSTQKQTKRKSSSKKNLPKVKLSLERVIGCTVTQNSVFACNPITGDIAYAAGCVVVIYNPKRNKQTRFFISKSNKPIVSLCYAPNGKYLAVGESGHQPSITIWELATKQIVSDFKGHTFGVACLAFSPNMKYLASVGYQHDGYLFVCEWKSGTPVASNKISQKVYSISFSEDGTYFVTSGTKHVKFWSLDSFGNVKKNEKTLQVGTNKRTASVIDGKSATLGTNKDSVFIDVACGKGNTCRNNVYSVTTKGLLVCFSSQTKTVERWVNLKATGSYAISVTDKMVICACSNGIIRAFDANTLEYIATLPRPHVLGKEYLGKESVTSLPSGSNNENYPDVIGCRISADGIKLSCIYSDRSLFVWDLTNPKKVGKFRSFLAHSGCIWDIDVFPDPITIPQEDGTKVVIDNNNYGGHSTNININNRAPFPPGTFVTCSADSTIRFWNLDGTTSELQRNVFSKEVLRTIYIGEDFSSMKAKDYSQQGAITELPSTIVDGGIRCVKISPDGQTLASGDRSGNLRAHDLHNLELLTFKEAHDAEILSLDFSRSENTNMNLVASASRDRLIHIFDANNNFDIVHTLDDHSSSITSVKFSLDGSKLLSCSADKSIVFRDIGSNPFHITRYHQAIAPYGTVYDMDVDAINKFIVTAGQDKKLNIYTIATGKSSRSYKVDSESGELIKVRLDPAGLYAATSSSDKCIRLYDFYSGECLSKVSGHSELVTGLAFTRDCTRLISVSGDGCIFIWKLSSDLTSNIQDRLIELMPKEKLFVKRNEGLIKHQNFFEENSSDSSSSSRPPKAQGSTSPDRSRVGLDNISIDFDAAGHAAAELIDLDNMENIPDDPAAQFRLSDASLPTWAKSASKKANHSRQNDNNKIPMPVGRWAQRVAKEGVTLFSELPTDEKPVAKWEDTVDRRFTIEVNSLKQQQPQQQQGQQKASQQQQPFSEPVQSNNNNNNGVVGEDGNLSETAIDSPKSVPPSALTSSARLLTGTINRDEEDDVVFASDSDNENDIDAESEEIENEDDSDANDSETIYLTNNTNLNFETAVEQDANTGGNSAQIPSISEPVEEEEQSQTNAASLEEQFAEFDKADFLKNNFESLASEKLEQVPNPLRLSLSSKFKASHAAVHPIDVPSPSKGLSVPGTSSVAVVGNNNNTNSTNGDNNNNSNNNNNEKNTSDPSLDMTFDPTSPIADEVRSTIKSKQREKNLLQEVEKTRQRLAQLGIMIPNKNSTDGGNNTMNSTSASTTPTGTVSSPTQLSHSLNRSDNNNSNNNEGLSSSGSSLPSSPNTNNDVPLSSSSVSHNMKNSQSLHNSIGSINNTEHDNNASEKESEEERPSEDDETDVLNIILKAPSTPPTTTKSTEESKQQSNKIHSKDHYLNSLEALRKSFETSMVLFNEIRNSGDQELLQSYNQTFSSMQSKLSEELNGSLSPSESDHGRSMLIQTNPLAATSASLMSTQSADLTRTLNIYSDMLLQIFKDKLNQ